MVRVIGSGLDSQLHREARERALNIVMEARDEAEHILREAEADAEVQRRASCSEATLAERERQALAQARLTAQQQTVRRHQALLDALWDRAAERLRALAEGSDDARRRTIAHLIVDAAAQLAGRDWRLQLAVAAHDRPLVTLRFLDDLHETLARYGVEEVELLDDDLPAMGGVVSTSWALARWWTTLGRALTPSPGGSCATRWERILETPGRNRRPPPVAREAADDTDRTVAEITWVSGPVVRAALTGAPQMMEQVQVGDDRLVGEVIGIRQGVATVQVYEDTTGIRPGDAVYGTGAPLSVELGPGLVGRIYDGIQRPLVSLADRSGDFIQRGVSAPPLDREVTWEWQPVARTGATVQPGDVLGVLPETPLVEHRVMAPPDVTGEVTWLAPAGQYTVDEPVARVSTRRGERTLTMMRRWRCARAGPSANACSPASPCHRP